MHRIKYIIVIAAVLLGLGALGFITIDKIPFMSRDTVLEEVSDLSYVRANLTELRLSIFEYAELDPNALDFEEKKSNLLQKIDESNKELSIKLEEIQEENKGIRAISLKKLFQVKNNQKYSVANLMRQSNELSEALAEHSTDLESVGLSTSAIYNIYFPGDYEELNIDVSDFYDAELKNADIFTDVKEEVEKVDTSKFVTKDVVDKLDNIQLLFEACISEIGKERIAYSDLSVCEDALSIDELKELTYHAELSYFKSDEFVETLTDLTNTAYGLDAAVKNLITTYEDTLEDL